MEDPFAPPQQKLNKGSAQNRSDQTPWLLHSRFGLALFAVASWAASSLAGICGFLLWHILLSGRYDSFADAGYASPTTVISSWLIGLILAPFGLTFWCALGPALLAVWRRQVWYCIGTAAGGLLFGWSWPPLLNMYMTV